MCLKNKLWPILLIIAGVIWPTTQIAAQGYGPPPRKIAVAVWNATEDGKSTDALVMLSAQANVHAAARLPDKTARGSFVRAALWDVAQRSQAPLRHWLDSHHIPYRAFYIVNMIQVQADRQTLLALAARPDVAQIAPNPWVPLRSEKEVPLWEMHAPTAIPWGVQKIGAPQVWDRGYTGQGVVVAGQDTGYQWDHPALIGHYRGWDGSQAHHDYNWHDAIHENNPHTGAGNPCGFNSPAPCDDYGHGTHTMGTMVGDDNNGQQIGVAPGAKWIGCRNMESGWGTPASYAECFEFFLAPYPVNGTIQQGDPSQAPDVINNSWSCPPDEGCDETNTAMLRQVVENVRAAGIMVVAAATNSGPSCSTITDPPAFFDASYTVGATDSNDGIAGFSSRGPITRDGSGRTKPDISAPGPGVYSSIPNDRYGTNQGTSMATPHVVGAIALLWSADPSLKGNISCTEALLNSTAKHIATTACSSNGVPNNVYGWGRLDIQAAVASLSPKTGMLRGNVRDPQDNPLANAAIVITGSSSFISTRSDPQGTYRLELPEGSYTVTASLSNYDPATISGVQVCRQQTTTLNINLTRSCIPVAGASFTTTKAFYNQPLTLTAAITAGTPPISYTWTFGDGSPQVTGQVVTHTFPSSTLTLVMPYTVTVTARNACGGVSTTKWIYPVWQRVYLPLIKKPCPRF